MRSNPGVALAVEECPEPRHGFLGSGQGCFCRGVFVVREVSDRRPGPQVLGILPEFFKSERSIRSGEEINTPIGSWYLMTGEHNPLLIEPCRHASQATDGGSTANRDLVQIALRSGGQTQHPSGGPASVKACDQFGGMSYLSGDSGSLALVELDRLSLGQRRCGSRSIATANG